MFYDFEFKDDGRRVWCTRGFRDAARGAATDDGRWYVAVGAEAPVRLLRVEPAHSRAEVWQEALNFLDSLEWSRPTPG
jgi:hypothetical protein